MSHPRFISITTATECLYALAEDGSVWSYGPLLDDKGEYLFPVVRGWVMVLKP